ncbi:MAG: alpha/beta hydrolase [Sphingomonas sp.]
MREICDAVLCPAEHDLLNILTLSDGGDPPPSWAREWAGSIAVHAHVDVGPRRASRRNLWATRLDEAVRRAERPVIIVAYGVSCFALTWWARLSPAPYFERVAGALLVPAARRRRVGLVAGGA